MLPASTSRSSYDKVRVQGSLDPFGEFSIQHSLDDGKSHPAKRLAWDVHRGEWRGHQFRHRDIHGADDGLSSRPTTEMSSGTRNPDRLNA